MAVRSCHVPGSETDLSAEPDYGAGDRLHRWANASGCLVRLDYLMTRDGPEHCGWQSVQEIVMGWPLGSKQEAREVRIFAKDPEGKLGMPELARRFDADAELPADARATGYRRGKFRLWMTMKDDFVFLVGPKATERRPGEQPIAGCV